MLLGWGFFFFLFTVSYNFQAKKKNKNKPKIFKRSFQIVEKLEREREIGIINYMMCWRECKKADMCWNRVFLIATEQRACLFHY